MFSYTKRCLNKSLLHYYFARHKLLFNKGSLRNFSTKINTGESMKNLQFNFGEVFSEYKDYHFRLNFCIRKKNIYYNKYIFGRMINTILFFIFTHKLHMSIMSHYLYSPPAYYRCIFLTGPLCYNNL